VLKDEGSEAAEHAAAIHSGGLAPGPFIECLARGADGEVDVLRCAIGYGGERLAGGGFEDGHSLASEGRGPSTGNEVLGGFEMHDVL
jgi:hypothetical protein